MKEYKVEIVRYIQNTFDSNKAILEAKAEAQTKLDEYASKGYRLVSTTASDSATIYLFFERDI
ncbi:DUF4177 domain-containing protein [Rudanella lutea]|uniref:DUF4177 domain-containing protein n=1 Tax=Rudanella lutea TaxID=451374 RepID=UPI0003675E2B|nr:DUF4177 domain-containing protein [Rudanella lutea]